MPYGRLRLWSTLRFRLTLWNTLALLVLVVVTLFGVREGVRYSLWTEADSQLVEDAREVQLTVEQLYPDVKQVHAELNRKSVTHTHRGLYIRIYDEQLREIFVGVNAPTQIFPVEKLGQHGLRPVTPAGGHYRLVHIHLEKPGLPKWTIRVGTSFGPLQATVDQLTRLLMAIGGGVLLVTPIGGYWLAGRATRPIAEIIQTTARLQPAQLNQRLPVRGTRDELDRLSVTINGFLDRIGAYIRQNREFTANAAHELRSPLTAIQSSLEVALNTDRSVQEYQELIETVLSECEGLCVLVNHLLLLAESDAGRLDVTGERVPLGKIVEQSCEMFHAVAENADVRLELTEELQPLVVRGHSGSLRQVVNNLIDNAIKFTPAGGEIRVSVTGQGVEAVLRVKDTGVGISAEDLPHMFQRFYRADRSRNRAVRSTGSRAQHLRGDRQGPPGSDCDGEHAGRGDDGDGDAPPGGAQRGERHARCGVVSPSTRATAWPTVVRTNSQRTLKRAFVGAARLQVG